MCMIVCVCGKKRERDEGRENRRGDGERERRMKKEESETEREGMEVEGIVRCRLGHEQSKEGNQVTGHGRINCFQLCTEAIQLYRSFFSLTVLMLSVQASRVYVHSDLMFFLGL